MNRRTFLKCLAAVCFTKSFLPICTAEPFDALMCNVLPNNDSEARCMCTDDHSLNVPEGAFLLPLDMIPLLASVLNRLSGVQQTVGYGNFCLLGFDDMLHVARSYPKVGKFSDTEIAFLEMIFYQDCRLYGFLGDKLFSNLTTKIDKSRAVKIPTTGNYLYQGKSTEMYHRISKDIGNEMILTAGIRGIVKQFYLFLRKALQHNGNLSSASRTIAPPGCSYHGVGDFDVGQTGFGVANFTARFTDTSVYQKLKHLDYVKFRYARDNASGVLFEPWHLEVV